VLHGRGYGLRSGRHIEFGEDTFDMEAYRALCNPHYLGDLTVCLAVFYPIEDVHFAQGQLLDAMISRLGVLRGGA